MLSPLMLRTSAGGVFDSKTLRTSLADAVCSVLRVFLLNFRCVTAPASLGIFFCALTKFSKSVLEILSSSFFTSPSAIKSVSIIIRSSSAGRDCHQKYPSTTSPPTTKKMLIKARADFEIGLPALRTISGLFFFSRSSSFCFFSDCLTLMLIADSFCSPTICAMSSG